MNTQYHTQHKNGTYEKQRNFVFSVLIGGLILIALVLFSACKKDGTGTSSSGSNPNNTTQFNMRMTDAPGNYDAVFVEIISAEIHSDVDGWVALNVKPGIYNLLDLTNGKDTLIGDGQIAVGIVSQIKLNLGTANSVVVDGKTYPLKDAGAVNSGINLQVHAELQAGINYNMLLDFDAAKSVVHTGNNQYILKPSIKVISKANDGAIQGILFPPASAASVLAINGSDTFSTNADLLSGGFLIGGLATANYTVVIIPSLPYSDSTINNISVNAGIVTNIGLITLK